MADVFGSFVIVAGCVVSVVFGSRSGGDVTVDELQENFFQIPFLVLLTGSLSFCALLFWKSKQLDAERRDMETLIFDAADRWGQNPSTAIRRHQSYQDSKHSFEVLF